MDASKPTGRGRLLIATATAAPLALAAAGCGGAGATSPAATPPHPANASVALIAAAARATLAAPAGLQLRLEGASAFGASSAPVLGSGEFDFAAARGGETIDLGETGSREPGNEQVLFLSGRAYLQPKGNGTSVLPPGKEWVSADLAGSEAVNTNFPSFTLQAEAIDPQLPLGELAGGTVAAAPLGATLVEGVPALGYRATVDLARALSALNGPASAALAQAIRTELSSSAGGSAGAGRIVLSLWIGPGKRIVQLQGVAPGAGTGRATMTLCCFGSPVRVGPPPSARVIDISSLTPSGERENNGGGDSDGG